MFVTFIIALEIVFRTTHLFGARISWTEPDPLIGWKFTPGYYYWHNIENHHPVTGIINKHGWRDKERSLVKPSNTLRIAVLGDSFVEAFQVELNETFLSITENRLNERHNKKIELLNFGRSGFTQTEELLVLKRDILKFSPDMIVLFFYPGNDVDDISKGTSLNDRRPFYYIDDNGGLRLDTSFTKKGHYKLRGKINFFKQHSALISFIAERVNLLEKNMRNRKNRNNDQIQAKINSYLSLCTANPEIVYMNNYQLNKTIIKTMAETAQQAGSSFMLVTLDLVTYLPEVENELKAIDPTFNAYFFEDDMKNFADLIGINYIGLQSIFKRIYSEKRTEFHWGDKGHWNYMGHEIVADALTERLESLLYTSRTR